MTSEDLPASEKAIPLIFPALFFEMAFSKTLMLVNDNVPLMVRTKALARTPAHNNSEDR